MSANEGESVADLISSLLCTRNTEDANVEKHSEVNNEVSIKANIVISNENYRSWIKSLQSTSKSMVNKTPAVPFSEYQTLFYIQSP
jgi:hypothetical protein